MTKTSYNSVMDKRRIKSYSFGYDIDNIKDVQMYVQKYYDEGDYNMHVARGDDVMNHMTIFRGQDKVLDGLIDSCYGEGEFEE